MHFFKFFHLITCLIGQDIFPNDQKYLNTSEKPFDVYCWLTSGQKQHTVIY